jgi:uncharacterized damage-inducible protein DinB
MSVSADFLRSQIDYTAWASLLLLDAAAALTPEELTRDFQTADRSIVGTLAHIFAGDRIWLARVSGAPAPGFIDDEDRSPATLQTGWPPVLEGWKRWATTLTDAEAQAQFAYTDTKGRPWRQPLWQVVQHVVNHGTHHRGQVSGFLRSLGHAPPATDLHHYYRSSPEDRNTGMI